MSVRGGRLKKFLAAPATAKWWLRPFAPACFTGSRGSRDSFLDATRGSFASVGLEYAPGWLGSECGYLRWSSQFSKYFPPKKPGLRPSARNPGIRPDDIPQQSYDCIDSIGFPDKSLGCCPPSALQCRVVAIGLIVLGDSGRARRHRPRAYLRQGDGDHAFLFSERLGGVRHQVHDNSPDFSEPSPAVSKKSRASQTAKIVRELRNLGYQVELVHNPA